MENRFKLVKLLLTLTIFFTCLIYATNGLSEDLTLEPGHLKPFGEGGPMTPIDEIDQFPNPKHFFENYVKPLRPLKMKGAAKFSKAFKKWTDDYFLTSDEAASSMVSVETKKKENRQQDVQRVSFKDFIRMYNNTEHYMVDAVPDFIKQDIMIPCPLQCQKLVEKNFVDNVMWFSSGGTKSVVHTDSVDNINCLFRGEKTLIMVDPAVHGHNVDIDRPDGSYSAMDVDAVDYTKYPGMAKVEFYQVNVSAGDCLYIPYLWIHQVRSYGSNLAVNVWWRHYAGEDLEYDTCTDPCDPAVTLEKAHFDGFGGLAENPEEVRDHLLSFIGASNEIDRILFMKNLLGPYHKYLIGDKQTKTDANEIFFLIDANKDGILTKDEIKTTTAEKFSEIGEFMQVLEEDIEKIMRDSDIDIDDDESDGEPTGENDDSDEMDLHDEL